MHTPDTPDGPENIRGTQGCQSPQEPQGPSDPQGPGVYQSPVTITLFHRRESGGHPAVRVSHSTEAVFQGRHDDVDFLNWELSGLFTVPTSTNPLTMNIYVSSHIDTAEVVQLQINKLTPTEKVSVFQTAVVVPGMGAIAVSLDVGPFNLRGETIEVIFGSPDPLQIFQLFPSVDVVELFPADGATLPLLFIPPGNFMQVFPVGNDAGSVTAATHEDDDDNEIPPIMLTTGIFDVPQGVFAVRPLVHVVLSSFSDEALEAVVEVFKLIRGTAGKERLLMRTVTVPPGEERQFTIEDAEGLPIEVNFTLSRDEQGDALLPSVQVTRFFTSDDEEESVILIPAGGMTGVFVNGGLSNDDSQCA